MTPAPALTVAAVGDLQLGDSPICPGFGFRSAYPKSDLGPVFARVLPLLEGAAVVFGNLETTLSAHGLRRFTWRSLQMRGDPEYAPALRRAGFTVLNVANNHAVQHGLEAFDDTVALLRQTGIRPCGLRGTGPWCSEPSVIRTHRGETAGFLGYCLRPRQYETHEPPFAEGTAAEILGDVARLRRRVGFVVVSLHWGEEFVEQPSRSEVRLAHAIVEAGASLVLGHHPHVLRPIERYAHGVIAYSLGNFVADMVWQRRLRRGVILRCGLDSRAPMQIEVTPTYIDATYRPITWHSAAGARTVEEALEGLDDVAYHRAARRTLRAQRIAGYRHALLNLTRYPPAMLGQLVGATLRHKISGLFAGARRRGRA